MKNNSLRKIRIVSFIIRWWSVGAVYFFIGWGTQLGSYDNTLDIIIILGGIIGLFHSFIVNPILKMLYNIGDKKKYLEKSVMEKVSYRLQNVVVSMLIVYLVTLLYQGINVVMIYAMKLDPDTVVLAGEPILFATFYMLIYTLFNHVILIIKKRRKIS